jgi:hypothetical protein
MKPGEAAVYDFCTELSTARDLLGEQQVVDLIARSGTYVTVAMLLAAARRRSRPARRLRPAAAHALSAIGPSPLSGRRG